MANKIGLSFKGFDEMIANLEALNGDVKQAVEGSLRVAQDTIAKKTKIAIKKHKRTGITEKSIIKKTPVQWEGTTASIDVGFKIRDGGLASMFLMHGTPKIPKDQALYDAIYGTRTKKEISKRQKAIFDGMISKRMGG